MISLHISMATAASILLMARASHLYREVPLPAPMRALSRVLGVGAVIITTLGLLIMSAERIGVG